MNLELWVFVVVEDDWLAILEVASHEDSICGREFLPRSNVTTIARRRPTHLHGRVRARPRILEITNVDSALTTFPVLVNQLQ